jgi:hypothetical protein
MKTSSKNELNDVLNEYYQSPEASNVFRKTNRSISSTPSGSYDFVPNIFYKHTNPPDL